MLSRLFVRPLLHAVDAIAALLLLADLVVVCQSVLYRYVLNAPIEWADDVARGLMVALSFFGAAGALARGENVGIAFFVQLLPDRARRIVDAAGSVLVAITAITVAIDALQLGQATTGQTTGSGLPLEWSFYPMGAAGLCMAVFALDHVRRLRAADILAGACAVAVVGLVFYAWLALAPDGVPPPGILMLVAFVFCMAGGMSIGFVLALSALVYVWIEGSLPGVIFAQQMARGIDNFVLLAIPFFILVGYLMEANGMSVRLIALLERLVGRMRGGLNVVMVLSMVVFSGISGSKMADVAAVGSVLIPAARRSRQNPGNAVALLASSAVMAETIPPCINLIILGFVANLSIGGLFMAGLVPAGLMALALIATAIVFGTRTSAAEWAAVPKVPLRRLWSGGAATLGLLVIIFGGFRSGFATATEISAFAAFYALVIGGVAFRELTPRAAARTFVMAATRSGLVLFIVAAAQSVAFVLTLQQIPHALGEMMIAVSNSSGSWLFMLLSILILIVMGSVLEGAAALIIFAPLLVPVAAQLGIGALHYGVVLVIAMGIGLFAPPLGLGLYGACLIGGVPIEATIRPMMKYLGLLLLCLLVIAFVPPITEWLPHALGY
ncbi:MAG: TRAP transporter large permease subunit [Proteobacteria bacterium]|nr:TRAP transporter large permease subunit [Pseudomonadota bacterium]